MHKYIGDEELTTSQDKQSCWCIALIVRNPHTNLDLFSWHVRPVISVLLSRVVFRARMYAKVSPLTGHCLWQILQGTMHVSRTDLRHLFLRSHKAESLCPLHRFFLSFRDIHRISVGLLFSSIFPRQLGE